MFFFESYHAVFIHSTRMALYCSNPSVPIAPNSLWQRNRWRVFAKSSLHHRQRLATQRISDRTRVDCTNVVAVAAAIADAVDENEYPLDGRAVGVTREICR